MRRLSVVVNAALASRVFYPIVWLACLAPGALLGWRVYQAFTGADPAALGVNPTETLLHTTGRTALALLLLTLTITPVRRLTGWNRLQSIRRTLGVWSFAYALSHVTCYVVFDQLGDLAGIWDDVANRPFITMGMLAFALLAVLAATSTNAAIRRLGRRWQRLHRLVYVAATAGIVHFVWGQKADIREPLEWAAYLAVLFAIRIALAVRKSRRMPHAAVNH
jgi:sulfoxide reductase heme-binding subunit YedZ